MSDKIDIFELFEKGRSGGFVFGKSTWLEVQKLSPELEAVNDTLDPGAPPNIAECYDHKAYFTYEEKPVFQCLRLLFSYPAGIWGMAGPTDASLSVPRIGRHRPTFKKFKWNEIQTLSGAIRQFVNESCLYRSGREKQIFVVWAKPPRKLVLEFRLEPHALDHNQYEFEYYLVELSVEDLSRSKISKAKLQKYIFGN
jgi:hypothetical protein